MDREQFANELADIVFDKADAMRCGENEFTLLTIGEFDLLSDLCDEIANIVFSAIKRESEKGAVKTCKNFVQNAGK